MKKIWWIIVVVLVLAGGGFYAYRTFAAGSSTSSAVNLQTVTVTRGTIKASLNSAGTVRTGQSALINWQTSGQVGAINVKLGDKVQAGQVLASLDQANPSAAMINAKQNLLNAQKTLADLNNWQLQAATAQSAVADAQKALDDLKQTDTQATSQAQVALANAQVALTNAQKARDALNSPHTTDPWIIQQALTKYMMAKQAYQVALNNFAKVASLPLTDKRRAAALNAVVSAKQAMDQAFANYNWYLQSPTASDIAQADANLALAQANLATAQTNYDSLKSGPTTQQVALAEAKLADAQRTYDLIKNGPNPDDVAAAQAAIEVAQATYNQFQITAPFTGVITDINILPGDVVTSGKQAFRIDDVNSIFTDLQVSEIDLNSLKVGQAANITFDAIPNKQYTGQVTKISLVGTVSQGVVNYTVTVQITNPDANVKPGMTAAVGIVTNQHDNVLLVPNQAVKVAGNQHNVTVLFEGQQIQVQVTVVLTSDTMSEVTSNQLKEGDEVIINPTASTTTNQNRTGGGGIGGFLGGFGGIGR